MPETSPDGSPGVDQLIEVGDDMAEALREINARPSATLAYVSRINLNGLVDKWRAAKTSYYKEKGNVPD